MRVCPACFDNPGLKRRLIEIRPDQPNEKCDFHPRLKGIPIKAVAAIVDVVFRNNYYFGRYNGMEDDFFGQDLSQTLYDLTEADDDRVVAGLARALVDGDDVFWPDLDEAFYRDDASYERSDNAFLSHGFMWEEFRTSIVHNQRFFNESAKNLLSKIFDGIHRQRDTGRRHPVMLIEPGSAESRVIRARIAESSADRKEIAEAPWRHMAAPPTRKRKPGRMNPSGICALYASYDLKTCISELRPRVGSIVSSAEFDIIRPIVVLDTTRFVGEPKEPNLFAKDHVNRMAQWRFMQAFMHEIAQPISPDDEHLDYVPTQAVSEYLLRHHRVKINGETRQIEAIVFRSAQHPTGKNIVIFGDACLVEIPIQAEAGRSSKHPGGIDPLTAMSQWRPSLPAAGLRYRPESLKNHRISEAEYTPTPFHDYSQYEDL